jgi:hypothetical protein
MIKIFLILLIIYILYEINNKIIKPIEYIKDTTKIMSVYGPVESELLGFVKNYVIEEMETLELDVTEQHFTRNINNKDYKFSNIIGINPNAKAPYILIGAHIDSPQIEGCESTIDAVTSISIILEITKNLLKKNPNLPIMLLFVDGEEAIDGPWKESNSLSGSKYFVNNYDLNLIDKVYILDLIGGDISMNKIAAFQNNPKSHDDIKKLYEINKKYNELIFINPETFISDKIIEDDHLPFKNKDKYVLDLIPYEFPKTHHTLDDNYNNVNWKYVEIFYNVFYEFLENTIK